MKLLGWFTCMLKGHKRGKEVKPIGDGVFDNTPVFQAAIDGYRLFRCPRCGGNERRYKVKVKPKSADVLQIPLTERKST